jgi:hypothetical protein
MFWIAKALEAAAARIALVAFHDGRPLVRRHGARARIRQQVDQDIVGGKQEQVVVRGLQQLLALFAGGPVNRLDALDPERFDDGLERHGKTPWVLSATLLPEAETASKSTTAVQFFGFQQGTENRCRAAYALGSSLNRSLGAPALCAKGGRLAGNSLHSGSVSSYKWIG